jgi:hypothetical protein
MTNEAAKTVVRAIANSLAFAALELGGNAFRRGRRNVHARARALPGKPQATRPPLQSCGRRSPPRASFARPLPAFVTELGLRRGKQQLLIHRNLLRPALAGLPSSLKLRRDKTARQERLMMDRTRDKIDFAEVVAVWLRRCLICPTLT